MKSRLSDLPFPRLAPSPVRLLILALSVTMLGACTSDNDSVVEQETPAGDAGSGEDVDTNTDITTLTLDASAGGFGAAEGDAANKWAYLDLDSGQVLDLTDAEASLSTQWDVALKRVDVRTNGGASGPGSVTAALADAQSVFYDEEGEPDLEVFSAATADSELPALQRAIDASQLTFEADTDVAAIDGSGIDEAASWWLYDAADHTVNPNDNAWYVVRGADGQSSARFHVTDIDQSSQQISVELFIQNTGESAFSDSAVIWTATIGGDGGSACYDFEQMVDVDCLAQADTWDLQFEIAAGGRSWNAWVNGGEVRGAGTQGAAFGPIASESIADYESSAAVPTLFEDSPGGVFTNSSWYAYDLDGNHRIWPNYRVYAVDTGDAIYKMQLLSYYDEAGTSGIVTLRYDIVD